MKNFLTAYDIIIYKDGKIKKRGGIMVGLLAFISIVIFLIICAMGAGMDVEKSHGEIETNVIKKVDVNDPSAKYIGGFPDVAGGKKASIVVKEDEIKIIIHGLTGENIFKNIPMDIIANAEIKSETQITKEVGLGKLIIFGVLAFAMKNEKNTVRNYLVINCIENGEKRDLVFESRLVEPIVREIRKIKAIESIF